MFFTHDHPFEECFCLCIVVLNKTWKEMRATSEDFQKVASVGQEQIVRALETAPASLEQFKTKLQTLTYSEITQLWQLERNTREEWESHAKPVVELREQITPEILGLIKQQRLAFLVEGEFMLFSSFVFVLGVDKTDIIHVSNTLSFEFWLLKLRLKFFSKISQF